MVTEALETVISLTIIAARRAAVFAVSVVEMTTVGAVMVVLYVGVVTIESTVVP